MPVGLKRRQEFGSPDSWDSVLYSSHAATLVKGLQGSNQYQGYLDLKTISRVSPMRKWRGHLPVRISEAEAAGAQELSLLSETQEVDEGEGIEGMFRGATSLALFLPKCLHDNSDAP